MNSIISHLMNGLRAAGRVMRSRTFAITPVFIMVAVILYIQATDTRAVIIHDETGTSFTLSRCGQPQEVLEQGGIEVTEHDEVSANGFDSLLAEISIDRAVPVKLTVSGYSASVMSLPDRTAGELLEQYGIHLNETDFVNVPLDMPVQNVDRIVVSRIEHTAVAEDITLEREVQYKQTSLLKPGATRLLTEGSDGLTRVTLSRMLVDGIVLNETVERQEVLAEPQSRIILQGAQVPISGLDFGIKLDASGMPADYVDVIESAVATGYSARPGARGASRMVLSPGYVAVNPDVIPYGTKMYIVSPDNRFIYGCAIAADTGTALMDGIIDVDLFYDTYLESCLNGRRTVNIYILED